MSFYQIYSDLHGTLGLPVMTLRERKVFKNILRYLKTRGAIRIFEYGTGFSTIYYSRFLRTLGADFNFYTVDNNLSWHQKIAEKINRLGLGPQVHLSVSAFPPFWDKPGWRWDVAPKCGQFAPATNEEKAYIQKPLEIGGPFDLIVVDGRFRQCCLKVARQVLSPHGIILLHDAHKKHYSLPTDFLPHIQWVDGGRFCPWKKDKSHMWLGSKIPFTL